MLDTNACIALINGRPESVRRRFDQALRKGDQVTTSSIVLFELWYGVAKSAPPKLNSERLSTFMGGPVDIVEFGLEDAESAGRIRAALEVSGRPIGAYDLLIAGQARRLGATLVTANSSEFSRIKALRIQDWA
ncbi:MAG: type II toxin-antitoxin system VapC family toxin [Candidatus Dormibacteraeota bacterium]|nr:type II toxin-antitoxin system VapC family toxin [Candidatus Dormibacteraeota bacterium]